MLVSSSLVVGQEYGLAYGFVFRGWQRTELNVDKNARFLIWRPVLPSFQELGY